MPCFAAGGSVDGQRLDGVADLGSVEVHFEKGVSEVVEWIAYAVTSECLYSVAECRLYIRSTHTTIGQARGQTAPNPDCCY